MTKRIKEKTWKEVEQKVNKERDWLKTCLQDFSSSNDTNRDWYSQPYVVDKARREIALLIIKGIIKAREFRGENLLLPYYGKEALHGMTEWHKRLMARVKNHFLKSGFNEIIETPSMNFGVADLAFWDGSKMTYIEIGLVSTYKMSINLNSMPNSIFLNIPDYNHIVEFSN